ncbi:hypothetical protein Dda_5630 [Drechslerella dactyloides]|uniref:Uncharacterized protein n=1 Tax=Drechslerella dactyloides TaxID=74499 RepID=A0AAD6IWV8_DREDA|nr:hypothetical protein Dda_5630 [Drechslerella dactyloides]
MAMWRAARRKPARDEGEMSREDEVVTGGFSERGSKQRRRQQNQNNSRDAKDLKLEAHPAEQDGAIERESTE